MKRIFLVGMFIRAALPLAASVLVSVDGPATGGAGNSIFASSWTQTGTHENVTISASLFDIPAAGVTATAWLTTAIGPTATPADQIATAPVTSPILFSGLTLGFGTYYLVLMPQSGGIAAGWDSSAFPTVTTAPDVTLGSSYIDPSLMFPAFVPSADLIPFGPHWLFTVSASDAPEPGSALLLSCGLVVLGGAFLRRRISRSAKQRWGVR